MIDFFLRSLRGGLNEDPPTSLSDDQCTVMQNVELEASMLGERRRGTSALTLASNLANKERVTFLHRHVPGADETAAELWAFGFTAGGSGQLARKTTSWSDVTMTDAATLTGFAPYQWNAVSLHGKLFVAYDSAVDRMHVADAGTTTLRRAGLAEPAAPTGADQGSGSLVGTRYYRVRYTVQSGGITLRRSEPSDALTFAPSGTGASVRVTKPTSISEDETHWELEASIDNVNFYVIATTAVGTSTYDDSQDYTIGYARVFELSEDIGDYTLIPSARYVVADEDRLVWGGSWESDALASRIGWSPVGLADGAGNDERQELDTDPESDLDGREGGPLSGLSCAVAGEIWAFKFQRIYKLVRSGIRTRAYDTICMSKERGALHGSVVTGVDEAGRPCVYFLDPAVGPSRAGSGGILQCGADVRVTWSALNLAATKVVCSGAYYPTKRQIIWNIATSGSNTPNLTIVLQTNEQRPGEAGMRRGWVTWTGTRTNALAMCLFASNVEAGTARNRALVPLIAIEGPGIHVCDTGDTDNGTTYAARIVTKPITMKSLLTQFNVRAAALLAKAVTGAKVLVKVHRDFGLETTFTSDAVTFDATGSETSVIKKLDHLKGAEMRVAQFEFADTSPAGTRFELNQFVVTGSTGQSS